MTLRLIDGGRAESIPFPLFDSALDRTGKRYLQRIVTVVGAARGATVAKQGEIGRDLLVLAEGVIKLRKTAPDQRRLIVAFRTAGDPVSLHRCDTPWPATAQAVSDCTLFRIEWDALRRLAGRYPAIGWALFDLANQEIANLQDRLLTIGRQSTEEKLAAFILEYCRPSWAPSGLGREVHLPMRRSDIADYLALATESVSREFSRLKRQRIIAMPRPSRIAVLNRPALEAAVQGLTGAAERPDRLRGAN